MEPYKFGFTKGAVKPHTFHAGFLPDKAAQARALKESGQGDLDLYDLLAEALAAGMAASGYGIEHAYKAVASIPKIGLDGMKAQDMQEKGVGKTSAKRNPLIDDATGDSPVTHKYLIARRYKKIGGNVLQGVSSALSAAPPTAVNIPGTIYHGQAVALTAVHIAKIEYISKKYSKTQHNNDQIIKDWCLLIRTMKSIKIAVRGTQLVGSVIPHASIPTSILSAVMKSGIKLTMPGACYAAAAQLQALAFQEQGFGLRHTPVRSSTFQPNERLPSKTPSRTSFKPALPTIQEDRAFTPPPRITGPDAGPASAVIWEIFTKRGATRLLGKYDVAALIREPAGWMALADKLLLI
ncbi:hypothetical protein [Acidisoma cladoniae]|jgi:hypothetical protein|uniref:hypothetical protein n=1 Tax=Acidisoma cladoniae TaxID=3040935 RepID=UPI00254AA716|nr:hypothetical protein [Acidisoma sp. PAMC 29798]